MANLKQSKKRARQAVRRRTRTMAAKSMMRTYLKNVVKAIATGDATVAQAAYVAVVPVLDRLAQKDMIHRNKAARHKSRLAAQIKKLAA